MLGSNYPVALFAEPVHDAIEALGCAARARQAQEHRRVFWPAVIEAPLPCVEVDRKLPQSEGAPEALELLRLSQRAFAPV